MTRSEVMLWVRLRARSPDAPSFRRQHPIGPYITDFCCSPAHLVVEVDGGVRRDEDRMIRDAHREAYLRLTKAQVAFPQIASAYDHVSAWVTSPGLTLAGHPREIYFGDFAAARPQDEVCDVAVPMR